MAELLAASDDRATSAVVILGLGNLLLGDEGLGVRALWQLQESYRLPAGVRLVDGGTLGLELLDEVESTEKLLVLDAALTDHPEGAIIRLEGDAVPAFIAVHAGAHDTGLAEVLALARFRDSEPEEIVVLGMQPATIELGWGLSPEVSKRLFGLVEAATAELHRWGFECTARH
jgi:hydrogenase maturation protease